RLAGENIGAADGPWISYMKALQAWGHKFPGFAKEVEGTEERDGTYYVYCLTTAARKPKPAERRGEAQPEFEETYDPDFVPPAPRRGGGSRRAPVAAGSSTGARKRT